MNPVTIGISAGRKYENYEKWISQTGARVLKLSHEEDNFEDIYECDGILLTGGEDIHPRFYGKPEYLTKYKLDDPDEARDEFELEILAYAEGHEIPLLGICRGLQIANVHFGGTLIPDIPSFGKPDHTKFEEGRDRYHMVCIETNSLLRKITGIDNGEVNSAHHQSADVIGRGLMISAKSEDGIVEALERSEGSFLMLVQWHPERMRDPESPLTKNIRDEFLKACV